MPCLRGLALDGAARFVSIDATALAQETVRRGNLGPGGARLVSEAVIATCLLSVQIKGEEQLSLRLRLDTPEADYIGEITADGVLRARLDRNAPIGSSGERLRGLLIAVRSLHGRELYRGASLVECDRLEQAVARHLSDSAQRTARLRLDVDMDEAGSVRSAAGFLVERLPGDHGVPGLSADTFSERVAAFHDRPAWAWAEEALSGHLFGEPCQVLAHRVFSWRCRCSVAQSESAISALGVEVVRDILATEGQAEVTCHFCGASKRIGPERLEALIERLEARSPP